MGSSTFFFPKAPSVTLASGMSSTFLLRVAPYFAGFNRNAFPRFKGSVSVLLCPVPSDSFQVLVCAFYD